MNVGKANKEYWRNYEAGTTPHIQEYPSADFLKTLPAAARVLDIGTGGGELAEVLSAEGFDVYGIDLNPHEIGANKTKRTKVHYSEADITTRTRFADKFFDAVLFRYTLTSIHPPEWVPLAGEVNRILSDKGRIWLAEPLVNDSYADRYELGSLATGDPHAVFVFKDKHLAAEVRTFDTLQEMQAKGAVSRIIRHYTVEELQNLFGGYVLRYSEYVIHTSPSGYALPTVVMSLQKSISEEVV